MTASAAAGARDGGGRHLATTTTTGSAPASAELPSDCVHCGRVRIVPARIAYSGLRVAKASYTCPCGVTWTSEWFDIEDYL